MQIQTANGAIALEDLGATLMHEHLVIGFEGWDGDANAPKLAREEVIARCVDRIEELKDADFHSLLDPCPNDLGRNVELYSEVAARTAFNILFATGVYEEQWAGPYWRFKLQHDPDGVDYLAAMYVKELTEGVGPSRVKPAVIKLAIGRDAASDFENKAIKAAAAASNATGAPILTHTDAVGGEVMLDKLKALGVPAHRVLVGHSCGSPDKAYHRRIVDGGGYIGFDRFGIDMMQSDEVRTDRLHSLLEDGYAQQVIVSHDCLFCQLGQMIPEGVLTVRPTHFSRNIAPKLRARGVAQATLDGIFRDNPRRFFCDEVPARLTAKVVEPAE